MIFALWSLRGLHWAVAALRRGPVERRQPPLERLARLTVMGAGFILFYAADPRWGALTRPAS